MNTTRMLGYTKALGFVAATCLAQAVTAHYSGVTMQATVGSPASAEAFRPVHAAVASSARSCSSLDSFGNPVRPCRG